MYMLDSLIISLFFQKNLRPKNRFHKYDDDVNGGLIYNVVICVTRLLPEKIILCLAFCDNCVMLFGILSISTVFLLVFMK